MPEQIRPWTQRPETPGHITPKQRPNRAQGPRPRQEASRSEPAYAKAPSPGHQEPQVHQRAETPATGRECGREEISPTFDGGPKLIQEREQPKTQPDKKNRRSQSQSHIPTLMRTHQNTHTHSPNVNTHNNGLRTLTYTPHTYSILPGRCGPLPSGVETDRLPQHQPRLVSAPPELERLWFKRARQPEPPH
ncbi:hypothetical protein CRENBAI_017710 [Crenichthys baileyi]|uniref:Uncharacterized protein n=1 Tax=Crenichthys baileyi TaxID=28760 RepID=A0AAV9R5L6_9TELE